MPMQQEMAGFEPREWQIILDLLEQERRELGPEIRHTDSPDVRNELRERLKTVSGLIGRLQGQSLAS